MTFAIAILGARGRLGHCVTKAALDAGHRVIAVTRDGRLPTDLADAEPRAANALDRQSLIAATEGADVVINALNPLYTDWAEMCMPMAENVIAACKANRAAHLFAGNIYNFGRFLPPLLDPETPEKPETRKGVIRIEIERLFRDAVTRDGVNTTVLRAGDFYGGTGSGSWFDLMIAAKLEKGKFVWPGRGDIPHAWAYLPDLGRAFVKVAEQLGELDGFNSFTFEGHTLSGNEMQALAELAVGHNLMRSSVPWIVLRAAGFVVPMLREVCEMSYLWFTPHALDGTRLETFIGTLDSTPPEQAMAEAIRDLPKSRKAA